MSGIPRYNAEPATTSPPWETAEPFLAFLRQLDEGASLGFQSRSDEFRAWVRDVLAAHRAPMTDEWVVFHGLVFCELVARIASRIPAGGLGRNEFETLQMVVLTVGGALAEYAPAISRQPAGRQKGTP